MLIQYIDSIFCCDIKTSFDKNIYVKYNIDIVINCTNNYSCINLKNLKKIKIPISNELNYHTDILLIKKNLNNILNFIYENYINNNILIVCYDGNTISPLLVGMFINKYSNIHINLIKDIMKSKNKNFNIEFDLNILLN
jgi:hypothetical protein